MDLSKVVGKMQVRIVWCSYWLFLLTKLGEPAKLLSEEVVAVYNATVDCRGGLLARERSAYFSYEYVGCGHGRGTCVWSSQAAHVSKSPYCVADGTCVPHAPAEDAPGGPLNVIVVLTQVSQGQYYHFVIDGLTRIYWIHKKFPRVLNDSNTYFHTGYVSEMGQAWCRAMGIHTWMDGRNRLLDGYWHGKVVLFPPSNPCVRSLANGPQGGPRKQAALFMQTTLHRGMNIFSSISTVSLPSQGQLAALVIIRDVRWVKRVVRNLKDVMFQIRRALPGWEVYNFTDYPRPPDQATTCLMFYRANLIIGPHGAGFANLPCARPGTPVVEFRKSGSPDYLILSERLGLPYFGFRTNIEQGYVDPDAVYTAVLEGMRKVNTFSPGSKPMDEEGAVGVHPASSSQLAASDSLLEDIRHNASILESLYRPRSNATQEASPSKASARISVNSTSAKKIAPILATIGPNITPTILDKSDQDTVQVLYNATISCKGYVWSSATYFSYDAFGCSVHRAHCVWGDRLSDNEESSYCLADGTCVPHTPTQESPAGPLDTIVVLTQPSQINYYEFVIDSLTRIYWIKKQFPTLITSNNTYFHTGLISEIGQAWCRAVGIDTSKDHGNKLLDGWWQARKVLFPPPSRCSRGHSGVKNEFRPQITLWLQNTLHSGMHQFARMSNAMIPPKVRYAALVIVPDPESKRLILLNLKDLMLQVRNALPNWIIYNYTDYVHPPDLATTCLLLHRADLIIAPHMTGFAMLPCARQNTPVVEPRRGGGSDSVTLTTLLGLPYYGFASDLDHGLVDPEQLYQATLQAASAKMNQTRSREDISVAKQTTQANIASQVSWGASASAIDQQNFLMNSAAQILNYAVAPDTTSASIVLIAPWVIALICICGICRRTCRMRKPTETSGVWL